MLRYFPARRKEIYAKIPRICEIDRLLSNTAAAILRTALQNGTDPTEAIEQLRQKNLKLQEERRDLLLQFHYPASYLEETPILFPMQ